jgi:hypothetical protein
MRKGLVAQLATVGAIAALGAGVLLSAPAVAIARSVSVRSASTLAPRWGVFFTSPRGPSVLTDITAAGRSSAWAAGTNNAGLYVMHWNGKGWRQQTVPGSKNCIPYSVQATSATSVWVMCEWAVNGPPTAFVLSGGTWRSMQLPDTDTAIATGAGDVWGHGTGGSCTVGPSPVCTSQVWHWSAGTLTTFSVPGEVLSMTAAGGHVWLLSEHGMTSGGGIASGGFVTAYEGSSSGLRKVAALGVRVGIFPQIAVSPKGRIWVLDEGRGKHGRAAVYVWGGKRWTHDFVPADAYFGGSWGFIYDGGSGAWLGPYTHWTGKRWVITNPSGPTTKYELMYVAPVAGTSSAWAVGFNSARPGSRGYRGLIALLGRRP